MSQGVERRRDRLIQNEGQRPALSVTNTGIKSLLALLPLAVLACSQAFAWGPEGHQIVGDIARDHLSVTAKQNLRALLGNDDLATISTWADEVRPQRPETYGWHFVDIPRDAAGFSEERDCYRPDPKVLSSQTDHQNCVVDRITLFKQILADNRAPQPDRLEALKFLVHFVGDIHQPMHAIEEARGGNDIHVMGFGPAQCGTYPCNLHYEWDMGLINHTGRSEQDYVAYLEQRIATENLRAGGTPENWANESLNLAKRVWVNDGGAVDEAYYRANITVLGERLALAGLRLAAALNDALSNPSSQPNK
jgi:hypothetical protein